MSCPENFKSAFSLVHQCDADIRVYNSGSSSSEPILDDVFTRLCSLYFSPGSVRKIEIGAGPRNGLRYQTSYPLITTIS